MANSIQQLATAEPSEQPHTGIERADTDGLKRYLRVVELHGQEMTQVAIAQAVGLSQAQVSRILAKYAPSRQLAALRAHNRALELTEATFDGAIAAARSGKPETALEIADRLDVLPKRQQAHTGQLQVIVNMPGQTVSQPPTIDLSPIPFASDAPSQGTGSH